MITVEEFLVRTRLEPQVFEAWVAAGWLVAPSPAPEQALSDIDVARARLIRELRDDLGVNDEGVSVVLHMLDQVHGLRAAMRELVEELRRHRDG